MRIIQEIESARGILDILNMNVQPTTNLGNLIKEPKVPLELPQVKLKTKGSLKTSSLTNEPVLDNTVKEQDNAAERYYDNTVDYRYICIKKEHFDVNMIYLKYMNLKKENYMEIIYKSPSIFLDGLFFRTPPLNISQLSIFTKDRIPYTSVITSVLDRVENAEFINILKLIDSYLSNYIVRYARDINIKMHEDEYHFLNYENILKPCYNPNKKFGFGFGFGTSTSTSGHSREQLPYSTITAGNISSTSTKWTGNYMINFKSYLERPVLDALKQSILDKNTPVLDNTEKKYVITFNISNIYFSKTAITPLIKCNKCEEVI